MLAAKASGLAEAGAGWLAQLRHAVRLLPAALPLRAAVVAAAGVAVLGLLLACWVLASSERTRRAAELLRALRGGPPGPRELPPGR